MISVYWFLPIGESHIYIHLHVCMCLPYIYMCGRQAYIRMYLVYFGLFLQLSLHSVHCFSSTVSLRNVRWVLGDREELNMCWVRESYETSMYAWWWEEVHTCIYTYICTLIRNNMDATYTYYTYNNNIPPSFPFTLNTGCMGYLSKGVLLVHCRHHGTLETFCWWEAPIVHTHSMWWRGQCGAKGEQTWRLGQESWSIVSCGAWSNPSWTLQWDGELQ